MFGGSKVNKFMELLGEKLMPLAAKLGENRYLTTLRDAFMLAFPLTMFGSIAVVLMNLPFWSDETKAVLQLYLGNAQSATMSIMTVFVVFGIGYSLSKYYKVEAIYGGGSCPCKLLDFNSIFL